MDDDLQAHIADLADQKLSGMFKWARRRDLRRLPEMLGDGESVVALAQGNRSPWWYAAGYWLIVLTDRRILLMRQTGVREKLQDFAFDRIRSVESNSDRMGGKLAILIPEHRVVIDSIAPKAAAAEIADYIRARIDPPADDEPPGNAGIPADDEPPGNSGPPEQIKKLAELRDAGILTEEEFEAKKTDLLARM